MAAHEDEASASRALEQLGFLPCTGARAGAKDKGDGEEGGEDEGGEDEGGEASAAHKHLTRLPQSSLTQKRAAHIERVSLEALARVESLRGQTAADMWEHELSELERHLREDRAFSTGV